MELRRLVARLGPSALLWGTGAALLAFTWKRWADVVSDTGRELYQAWRLSAGDVLYRDVAHFNGPLSPYLDALWFRLVGVGFTQQVLADLLVVVAITALVVRGGRVLTDRFTATAAGLVFLCVFAFGPLTPGGSFGYLAPYSHEMTHGALLLLLLLPCLAWDLRTGSGRPPLAAGLLLGLLFLTKPELWLAGAACAGYGFLAARRWRALPLLLAGAVVPPLLAFGLLACAMPPGKALRGTLGAWLHLADPALVRMPYFQIFMGTWEPARSVLALASWSLVWTAVAGTLWLAARAAGPRSRTVVAGTSALLLALSAWLAAAHRAVPWLEAMRPLPLFLLGLLGVEVVRLRRAQGGEEPSAAILRGSLSALALVLLLKMLLYARVWHYGFVLGMPGTLLLVAALLCWIPAALQDRGRAPSIFRTGAASLLAAVLVGHLAMRVDERRARTVQVGHGPDAFWADAERGEVMRAAQARIETLLPEDATLAVLPDGVMLNYLARRRNPTPYIIGNPADMAMFGEGAMLDAYAASPPDWIALLACDTTIYGFPFFGRDYAQAMAAWMDRNYVLAEVIGAPPFTGRGFGVALLRRRSGGEVP
ncbi:MAG TPA: hypothetical protein VFV75_21095 [Candidatus Polarisedimenticolaceae bacterium]|nr:hypothetical protein [Candidatus Polarisedimenticolaceae bacterium]